MAHHKLVVLQVPCQLNCTKRPFAQTFLHFIPFASSDKGRLLQLRHWIGQMCKLGLTAAARCLRVVDSVRSLNLYC